MLFLTKKVRNQRSFYKKRFSFFTAVQIAWHGKDKMLVSIRILIFIIAERLQNIKIPCT